MRPWYLLQSEHYYKGSLFQQELTYSFELDCLDYVELSSLDCFLSSPPQFQTFYYCLFSSVSFFLMLTFFASHYTCVYACLIFSLFRVLNWSTENCFSFSNRLLAHSFPSKQVFLSVFRIWSLFLFSRNSVISHILVIYILKYYTLSIVTTESIYIKWKCN